MRTRKIEKNDITNKEEVVFFSSKGIDKNQIVCVVNYPLRYQGGLFLTEQNNTFDLEKTSDNTYECTKLFYVGSNTPISVHLYLSIYHQEGSLQIKVYLTDTITDDTDPYQDINAYLIFNEFPTDYKFSGGTDNKVAINEEYFNIYFFYRSVKIEGNTYATGSEGVAQDLYQRLSLLQGELVHHINAGFPLMQGNCNKQMLDAYMIKTIINTPDVSSIISLESKIVDRRYICSFVVNTPYGILTLSEKKIVRI